MRSITFRASATATARLPRIPALGLAPGTVVPWLSARGLGMRATTALLVRTPEPQSDGNASKQRARDVEPSVDGESLRNAILEKLRGADGERAVQEYLEERFENDVVPFNTITLCAGFDDDFHSAKYESAVRALKPKCPLVKPAQYLDDHLNNKSRGIDFVMCHRDGSLAALHDCVPSPSSRVNTRASPKRNLVVMAAIRGAGKTTLLKCWLGRDQYALCQIGRVLVMEPTMSWCRALVDQYRDKAAEEDVFVVKLIEAHLRDIGCLGDGESLPHCGTVEDAYREWETLTAVKFGVTADWKQRERDRHGAAAVKDYDFRPLIAIDTCEYFAGKKHGTRTHQDGSAYNLLEAMVSVLPSERFVVAFGTRASVASTLLWQTHVNTIRLGDDVLEPLPFREALSYYKTTDPHGLREEKCMIHDKTFWVVHKLTGGVPRLLDEANTLSTTSVLSMLGQFHQLFMDRVFHAAAKYYGAVVRDGTAGVPHLAAATMASLTRWDDWPLQVPRERGARPEGFSLEDAVELSVGVREGSRLKVPPVFAWSLPDGDVEKVTGVPSLQLSSIACPLPEEAVQSAQAPAISRGRPYERLMVHALLCRYVLARWKRQADAAIVDADWVPLRQLLRSPGLEAAAQRDAALASLLDSWEVNLSAGLVGDDAEPPAADRATFDGFRGRGDRCLQWNQFLGSAHHDAYLWGRKATSAGGAAHRVIALQMRHGHARSGDELRSQLLESRASKATVPLLLSLHGGGASPATVLVSQQRKFDRGANVVRDGDTFLEVSTEHLCDSTVVWALSISNLPAAMLDA